MSDHVRVLDELVPDENIVEQPRGTGMRNLSGGWSEISEKVGNPFYVVVPFTGRMSTIPISRAIYSLLCTT